MDNDKPVSREEMLEWVNNHVEATPVLFQGEMEIVFAIRSVLTSTPERPEPFSDEIQDPCPTCGQDLSNVDFRKYKKGRQDARGEGVESRQVGIVFKCKGCGREVEAFQRPDPEIDHRIDEILEHYEKQGVTREWVNTLAKGISLSDNYGERILEEGLAELGVEVTE